MPWCGLMSNYIDHLFSFMQGLQSEAIWNCCTRTIMPFHVGTLAPPGECDWTLASFGPPESTTQTLQPFLHSWWQKVSILYNGPSLSPKIALSYGGLEPHLTHDSLGPSEPVTQRASRSFQPFLHRWPQSVPVLYNATPLPLKIAPSHWGIWTPHLIHGSLGLLHAAWCS